MGIALVAVMYSLFPQFHTPPAASFKQARSRDWIWGVTVDDLDDTDAICESIAKLPRKVTVRTVFDGSAGPEYYRDAVQKLHANARIMGQPLDSVFTKNFSIPQYRDRMASYMDRLKGIVDIWEIGNEVNGDWSGPSPDVAAKVELSLAEAKKRKQTTALTLFYSDFYLQTDREMDAWSRKYLSTASRQSVDYVLVSFYPQRPWGKHPDWTAIFSKLARTFPKARLGFGEIGVANPDFTLNNDKRMAEMMVRRYYTMAPPIPSRYIGGYFWWSFRQDAVPYQKQMWNVFNVLLRR